MITFKRKVNSLLLAIALTLLIPTSSLSDTAKREYRLNNCERQEFWKEVAIDFRYTYPEAMEVLKAIPKPDKAARLTLDEERRIEFYKPRKRAKLRECLLLVKEVNQFVGSIYKITPKKGGFYAFWMKSYFVKHDIPYLFLEDKSRQIIFSLNLSAVDSPDSF